ncbi:MAG: Urease accessory protein ureF [Ferruginibacter sp.]|nr:Urease accessory protein ureF [Ferruginibacter sp.]
MSFALLSLLQLSDPALPVGGYAHSNGLETYVQQGVVHNKDTACRFVTEMLTRSLQFTDAAFVSLAMDAAAAEDFQIIIALDEECSAVKLPKEIRQASQKLGIRLIKIFQPVIKNALADWYRKAIEGKMATGHYCIAFGLYAQALGLSKKDALTGFYYNAAAGMVTNSVKLVPLGQQEGQEILFSVQPLIAQLVENTLIPNRNLLGLCCTGFDIRCMQHEQLYSRLYMS